MKNTILAITALSLTTLSSYAAISFSSTAAVGLRDNGGTNIVSGDLVLLVVDHTNDGFLGGLPSSNSGLGALADPKINASSANITTGELFGGDRILGTFSASGGGSVAPGFNGTIAGLENRRFALVWFQDSAAALASTRAGAFYGIASGDDWTLPSSDSGAYTFNGTTNTTTSVYWQLASATSAAQVGSNGFFTGSGAAGSSPIKSATFQVVPEPSAALLGALGALGLLRRRRA